MILTEAANVPYHRPVSNYAERLGPQYVPAHDRRLGLPSGPAGPNRR
jgi:hypothetical protein